MKEPLAKQQASADYHVRMAAQYAKDADRKAAANARVWRARPAGGVEPRPAE